MKFILNGAHHRMPGVRIGHGAITEHVRVIADGSAGEVKAIASSWA